MRQILKTIKAELRTASKAQENSHATADPPQATPTATASTPYREGDAPAEPPQADLIDAAPEPEPVAPPVNRAQRRAQARLESKLQRKAEKRSRYAQAKASGST